MTKATDAEAAHDKIWEGDLLGRRVEADTIQAYIEHESAIFLAQKRGNSLVLAIDAQYGQGKSWFLDKLAQQLALDHPVARMDAWADDASEEPLTAFMASIDDALSPYLTSSKKLRDKMAAAKVAALPVMGRLVKGVMVKGLSKIAGDEAQDVFGAEFENAVRELRDVDAKSGAGDSKKEDGAVAKAVEGAFEGVGKEIDNLVDRRGAAMLAEYRQRKKSRKGFRRNMAELVGSIDSTDTKGTTPLVVIIDELDRCRPDYAIRVLEEIKHFFEVPGVVFILAVHGEQLQASIEAVYGPSFDAEHYLRRFFTRRWQLRPMTMLELVAFEWESWSSEAEKFYGAEVLIHGHQFYCDPPVLLNHIFDALNVTAREARAVLDVLRLMAIGWGAEVGISILVAGTMAVNFVRSDDLRRTDHLGGAKFALPSIKAVSQNGYDPAEIKVWQALREIWKYEYVSIDKIANHKLGGEPTTNYASNFFESELKERSKNSGHEIEGWSLISQYEDRLTHVGGFLEHPRHVAGKE